MKYQTNEDAISLVFQKILINSESRTELIFITNAKKERQTN